MNTFVINGKTYKAKEITFNFMCFLEEKDLPIEQIETKPMKFGREYLAYCGGMTSEQAGMEIDAHVVSGGELSVLYDAMGEALENSDFFRAMANPGKKAPEEQKPKRAARKE